MKRRLSTVVVVKDNGRMVDYYTALPVKWSQISKNAKFKDVKFNPQSGKWELR